MGEKMIVGKVIKIPAMRRGLCAYHDETVLLSQEALKRMADTVHGIPVVIDHQRVDASNVDRLTVGRVADMHYDAESDNWDVHFVVDDEDAVRKLNNGWGVSTAYLITKSGPGGTLNAVPYDREVLEATYDHLAIVQTPRYEMAKDPIFYNSADEKVLNGAGESSTINDSFQKKGISMFGKLFRKVREEIKVNATDELFVQVGDKEMPLAQVVQAIHDHEMKANSKKIVMNADDVVEYNGAEMTVKDLVEKYNACHSVDEKKENEEVEEKEEKKENTDAETKSDEEVKDEEKKENTDAETKSDEEKKENEEAEEKKENAADAQEMQNFADLQSRRENAARPEIVDAYMTIEDKLALGRKLFGSTK